MTLQGTYLPGLVILSVLVAVIAAYTTLSTVVHINRDGEGGRLSKRWLAISAASLGMGAWSMHFIGMLAWRLPIEIGYDIPLTVGSLGVTVLLCAAGLGIAFASPRQVRFVTGGLLVGGGIIAMHYIGMAAMRLDAGIRYEPGLATLSAVLAAGLSIAVLRVAGLIRQGSLGLSLPQKLAGAGIMGGAISGLHYLDMAAVELVATGAAVAAPAEHHLFDIVGVALGVAVATTVILLLAQYSSHVLKLNTAYGKLLASERQLRDRTRELEFQKAALDEHAIVSITDARGRITYANHKFCEVCGYSQEELIGQDHRILNSGFHPRGLWTEMWRNLAGGRPWRGVIKNRKKGGDHYWVESTMVPLLDEHGSPMQYVSIRTEITELMEARRELERARDAAEASSAAKSDFLSVMSHELRSPLHAILGGAQLLEATKLADDQAEYTALVHQAGDELLELIDEILEFSRLDRSQLETEACEFDLRACVDEVVAGLMESATGKGLKLTAEYANDLPKNVTGYLARIQRVLHSLLDNAIKFTGSGTITIWLSTDDAPGFIRFEVEDTGQGIPKELQNRVFDEFVQAESALSHHKRGVGLGLAFAKRLVIMMGGEIGLDSEPGRGTVCWFTLPLEQASEESVA